MANRCSWLTAYRRRPWNRPRLRLEELESRDQPSAVGLIPGSAAADAVPFAQRVPDDTLYATSLWNMRKIGAPSAWDVTTGRTSVVVADTDSGIDYTHPDLYPNVWINQAEIPAANAATIRGLLGHPAPSPITFWELNSAALRPSWGSTTIADVNQDNRIDARDVLADAGLGGWANGVSEDGAGEQAELGRGFVDDLVGWDFWNGDNDPYDDNGHGTHTAGTIGAVGNNGLGVAGLSWVVQVMPVKIIGPTNTDGNFTVAAAGVRYAAFKGARVSNNSWGGTRGSPELKDAVTYAQGKGQLFVAAAMNNGVNNDTSPMRAYPASYDLTNIISVAATDANDARPKWSNYGRTTVDLGAPGVGVWSTVPVGTGVDGGDYAPGSGTSMAAPHVAGAAALLLAKNPSLTYAEIKSLLLSTVDKVKPLATVTVSGGRLNVAKALTAAPGSATSISGGTGTTTASASTSFAVASAEPSADWTLFVGPVVVRPADALPASRPASVATPPEAISRHLVDDEEVWGVDSSPGRHSDQAGRPSTTSRANVDVLRGVGLWGAEPGDQNGE